MNEFIDSRKANGGADGDLVQLAECDALAVPDRGATLSPAEAEIFAEFVAFATNHFAVSQTELAKMAGISKTMISKIVSGAKPAGGKTVRTIAEATGVSIDDILSGAGIDLLKQRKLSGMDLAQARARTTAACALATLYGLRYRDASALMDDVGESLSGVVSPQTWFDVARSALERKRSGLSLASKPR